MEGCMRKLSKSNEPQDINYYINAIKPPVHKHCRSGRVFHNMQMYRGYHNWHINNIYNSNDM